MSPWSSVLPAPGPVAAPDAAPVPAARPRGAHRARRAARPQRRWWVEVALVTVVGFGIRLGTVLGRPGRKPGGDAYYYHYAANLLVGGYGFIDPWKYYLGHPKHQLVQTADWPPLFVWVLAMAAVVGVKSFFAQRVWCCVVGAAAVVVCGLAGREVAGRRAGLIAALLAAVYPNLWMSDELALSETLTPLLVALVLWCTFRFWKKPTYGRMVALGLSLGVAILGRDELALLIPLVLIPMALFTKAGARRRLALAGLGTVTALTVVAPWVGYNMSRFEDPTFVSTGFGVTLASANCPITWSGKYEGYWSLQCSLKAPIKQNVDKSVQSAEAEAYGMHYIRSHLHRLVPVELARLGRAFGA
ncbi:MAG TPA: glycosyltransferase family 39 protein, partial [Acidimicrobiales bacterium]|nr:glycosyltransferase family 39 protein [Acidimicrobiales bacterium]